jgi:RNA polymerase sigma factor (sigma-70 family)
MQRTNEHPWKHAEETFQDLYRSEPGSESRNDALRTLLPLVVGTVSRFLADLTCGDVKELAKDIGQEFLGHTIIRVFQNYDPARPFFPYGYRSLWRHCRAYCRRKSNRGFPGLPHEPMDARCNPVRDASRRELRGTVGRALWQIPKDDRRLIYLRYWKGARVSEIAAGQGRTSNAVSIRLNRLRKKLKALLKRFGDFFA